MPKFLKNVVIKYLGTAAVRDQNDILEEMKRMSILVV
jgi:hypothetical protein